MDSETRVFHGVESEDLVILACVVWYNRRGW